MNSGARRASAVGGVVIAASVIGWLLFIGLPRWYGTPKKAGPAVPATAPAPGGKKIKARLYYVGPDGTRLTAVERDVAYGEGTIQQATEIITAQIAPAPEGLVSAVPVGTSLRALFLDDQSRAYVDLSEPVSSAHSGGTLDEILTVYTIVDALTSNLPAIKAVQILVDGKEVDTLAGHVDLRQPLARDLSWVQ